MSRLALRPIGVLGVDLLSWVPPSLAQGVVGTPLPLGEEVIPASVPFRPGERATYRVRVGLFGGVGAGTMEVLDLVDVRRHPPYNLRLTTRGAPPFFKGDPRLDSSLDLEEWLSRRLEQDQRERRS